MSGTLQVYVERRNYLALRFLSHMKPVKTLNILGFIFTGTISGECRKLKRKYEVFIHTTKRL